MQDIVKRDDSKRKSIEKQGEVDQTVRPDKL